MNDKGHLLVSALKSIIRIIGCLGTYVGVVTSENTVIGLAFLSITFALAEVLGIVEELVDKR